MYLKKKKLCHEWIFRITLLRNCLLTPLFKQGNVEFTVIPATIFRFGLQRVPGSSNPPVHNSRVQQTTYKVVKDQNEIILMYIRKYRLCCLHGSSMI